MTIEAAKGNLIHAIRWNDMPKKEALEMALNHWSKEPKIGHWIPVSEELPDKEEYWIALEEWKKDFKGFINELSMPKDDYNGIMEYIDELPVTPQPQTGYWILQPSNKEQGERDFIWWKCSECGQVIYSETEKDRREYHAFCGRCGAKMIEPQERRGKE